MESELFGHKRGSFTGAVADKKGLVQSAEGGTLFLDEVADLPLHMQVKLLRVVQEKTVRPVGESREETVDVRILSATHKNLAQLVADRPLPRGLVLSHQRHRAARAKPARAAGRCAGARGQYPAAGFTPHEDGRTLISALKRCETLENYSFPGNVRELENVLERAVTLCADGLITADNIKVRAPRTRPPVETLAVAPAPLARARARWAISSKTSNVKPS